MIKIEKNLIVIKKDIMIKVYLLKATNILILMNMIKMVIWFK